MKNINEFLDKVKSITGSDYETAKQIGVERQTISGWRRKASYPKNTEILMLCDIAKINFELAVTAVEMSREGKTGQPELWKEHYKKLSGVAAGCLMAVNLVLSPAPVEAAQTQNQNFQAVYIM